MLHGIWFYVPGHRLRNVYIGVTNVSPLEETPTPNPLNYKLCAFNQGELDFAKQIFRCEPHIIQGRYVIIQIQSDVEPYLTLCEVEVYKEDPGSVQSTYVVYTKMFVIIFCFLWPRSTNVSNHCASPHKGHNKDTVWERQQLQDFAITILFA